VIRERELGIRATPAPVEVASKAKAKKADGLTRRRKRPSDG
jgi:large subunit ribosomal protein L29